MVPWFLLIGLAQADCEVVESANTNGKRDRRTWEMTVADGHPSCRRLVLGHVMVLQPKRLRALIEQSDATQQRFNLQRVLHENGQWVLYLPELRNGDWARVRMSSDSLKSNPLWNASGTKQLPDPHVLSIRLESEREPRFGPYGTVSAVHTSTWDELDGQGVWRWFAPSDATDVVCGFAEEQTNARIIEEHALGCLIELDEGAAASLVISWRQSGASSSGEYEVPGASSLYLSGADFSILGMNSVSDGGELTFRGPGTFSYRVTEMGGVSVPDTVVEQIELDANAVSIPEPGIGLQFKDRRADLSVLPEVLQIVRQQTVNGQLPGLHPLHPRPLMKVRRSRWGTSWEQSLLLARYLQQLRIDATPYPVRPQSLGLAESGAPVGYSGAVVRVRDGENSIWLDPSCSVCAVGEISPALWGGQVLADDLDALPARPESVRSIQTMDGQTTVELSGVYGVELRQWLAEFPVRDRKLAMIERYGEKGAELIGVTGLNDLGAPIRFTLQSRK